MAEQSVEETVQATEASEELDFDLKTLNHELVAVNRC
jgi:hypothetical protein